MSEEDLRGSLADVVRTRRTELGLSQRGLAKQAGVADATISKLETQQLSPSLETLAKVAAGLEMGISELISAAAPAERKMRKTYSVSSGSWASMLAELAGLVVEDMGGPQEAADALGISRSALGRWLSGSSE